MYSPNSLLRESVMGGELHRHWAFFTGTGLASYRQMRGPPCATLEPTDGNGKPGRRQWGKEDDSGSPDDHGSFAGGKPWGTSPTEGLPPKNTLLRTPRGGAWLPTPLLLPPVPSS